MKTNAKTKPEVQIGVVVVSASGRKLEVEDTDSLTGWFAILRWNLHHHYWRLVAKNVRDLPKYVWRRIWRLTS